MSHVRHRRWNLNDLHPKYLTATIPVGIIITGEGGWGARVSGRIAQFATTLARLGDVSLWFRALLRDIRKLAHSALARRHFHSRGKRGWRRKEVAFGLDSRKFGAFATWKERGLGLWFGDATRESLIS